MKTVKFCDGLELTYDDELKVGDLITTYYKGYYKFVGFQNRHNECPIACFKRAYDLDGKPRKSKKIMECDAFWCRKASDKIKVEIEKRKNEIVALEKLLNEASNV